MDLGRMTGSEPTQQSQLEALMQRRIALDTAIQELNRLSSLASKALSMEGMGKGRLRLDSPPQNLTLAENCNERAGSWFVMPANGVPNPAPAPSDRVKTRGPGR